MTVLLIILIILLGLTLFFLLTPIRIELDSRIPRCDIRWQGLGSAAIFFQDEWKVEWRVPFYHRLLLLENMSAGTGKKKQLPRSGKQKKKKKSSGQLLLKMIRVARSFIVEQWQLAIDTGDASLNARLYPLNWMSGLQGHLEVNFIGEQFFHCRIRNNGWRIIRAWLRH